MNTKSHSYLDRLKVRYKEYGDNDSLLALAEIEKEDERIRELAIYREQPKTQELIIAALKRYKECVQKLTHADSMKMTQEERAHCFATMDWAKFTLSIVGEDPRRAELAIDTLVEGYARKSGFIGDV